MIDLSTSSKLTKHEKIFVVYLKFGFLIHFQTRMKSHKSRPLRLNQLNAVFFVGVIGRDAWFELPCCEGNYKPCKGDEVVAEVVECRRGGSETELGQANLDPAVLIACSCGTVNEVLIVAFVSRETFVESHQSEVHFQAKELHLPAVRRAGQERLDIARRETANVSCFLVVFSLRVQGNCAFCVPGEYVRLSVGICLMIMYTWLVAQYCFNAEL